MNVCKQFMSHIRKVSYKEVCLLLGEDIFPQLTKYVTSVDQVPFEDGLYHTYYGDIKKLIESFNNYWKCSMENVIQEAHGCTNSSREELLDIVDRTVDIHKGRQIAFGKYFLPVNSPIEKQSYEEMEELYEQFMKKLYELQDKVESLKKQDKIEDLVKAYFKMTVSKTAELFEAAHTFLTMMLVDRMNQIKVSLEEILLRLRNNLIDVQMEQKKRLVALHHELYEKNKELLNMNRQDRKSSVDCAEAMHGIEIIRSKINDAPFKSTLSRLEEEVAYWERRVNDFHQCSDKLFALKKEHDEIANEEQAYNNLNTMDLPGSNKQCWVSMGVNLAERKQYLKDKIIEVAKAMMTFFTVKGADRVYYKDDLGMYYIDEFKHRVYTYNYRLESYHVDNNRKFWEVSDKNLYYFDTFGRYVKGEKGEKVYQCAPCTSQYTIGPDDLLKKTKSCAHKERQVCEGQLQIEDLTKQGILPIDLMSTLDSEAKQYLWDSFGHVLPLALRDVACEPGSNPIQTLAHQILRHKYNKTKSELQAEMEVAEEYRTNIFKERKEEAIKASKAWKAKQTKRRKPEESDDLVDRIIQELNTAERAFTQSINYYN